MARHEISGKPVQPAWRARREAYNRLGSHQKRRLRDRSDVGGTPDMVAEHGKYGDRYLFKGTEVKLPRSNVAQRYSMNIRRDLPPFTLPEFVGMAPHVAKRFAQDLEKSVTEGIIREMGRALKLVRHRAEEQLGHDIAMTGSESKYLRELKMYVVRNIQQSAVNWEAEIHNKIVNSHPRDVWKILVQKETRAMLNATVAARTLLGATYNSYMAFLMGRDKNAMFKWINPNDKRTTPCCAKLVSITANGVTLDQLKVLVKQNAEQGFYDPKSPFLPHFQCRSTFVVVNA
jgi:hypothetical protein